jgi:hypothetical protein
MTRRALIIRRRRSISLPESAIYFAVDNDASGSDIVGPINEYFRGIAAGFAAAGGDAPDYRVGGLRLRCGVPGTDASRTGGLCLASDVDRVSRIAHFAAWNIKQGKALPGMSLDHHSRRGQRRGSFRLPDDGVTHWHHGSDSVPACSFSRRPRDKRDCPHSPQAACDFAKPVNESNANCNKCIFRLPDRSCAAGTMPDQS